MKPIMLTQMVKYTCCAYGKYKNHECFNQKLFLEVGQQGVGMSESPMLL